MRRTICLCAIIVLSALLPSAERSSAAMFPIRTAGEAIGLAEMVCLKHGGPLYDEDANKTTIREALRTLKWGATLDGDIWQVDTMPSIVDQTNDHLLMVDVPVNGPAPIVCQESLYSLIDTSPPKPAKPRPVCKPSSISTLDAQELALEAVAPDGGVWLESSRAISRGDSWQVSVRDGQGNENQFKINKRTANVVNLRTGEEFTSLRSKAQFVEHHCLYAQSPQK
jgi:hypothetical protein